MTEEPKKNRFRSIQQAAEELNDSPVQIRAMLKTGGFAESRSAAHCALQLHDCGQDPLPPESGVLAGWTAQVPASRARLPRSAGRQFHRKHPIGTALRLAECD